MSHHHHARRRPARDRVAAPARSPGRAADDLTALADALDARDLALIVTLEQDGGDDVGGAVPLVREHDGAVARRAAAHIGRPLSSARSPGSGKLRQVIRDSDTGEGR